MDGSKPWEDYTASVLQGSPTSEPRLANVPVRLPLPVSKHQGSIYETQRGLKSAIYGTNAAMT